MLMSGNLVQRGQTFASYLFEDSISLHATFVCLNGKASIDDLATNEK